MPSSAPATLEQYSTRKPLPTTKATPTTTGPKFFIHKLRYIPQLTTHNSLSPHFIDSNSSLIERLKFMLCKKLVAYKYHKKLSQRDLAILLDIDEARISEIAHYKFEKFTVDKLLDLIEKVDPKTNIQVS